MTSAIGDLYVSYFLGNTSISHHPGKYSYFPALIPGYLTIMSVTNRELAGPSKSESTG